ncbi:MAG: hypothetical protein QG555_548, partial [Thermodesulfobacteriota bacterium]|nr:hypothetical protein [Thermodesulfobacteriota bacterium]
QNAVLKVDENLLDVLSRVDPVGDILKIFLRR